MSNPTPPSGSTPPPAAPTEAPAPKKRSRYTSVACNECKRRKIKCNGEKPCERCGNQNLNCVYESPNFQESDEYRRMATEIEMLKGQVDTLFGMVRDMKAEMDRWGLANGNGQSRGAGGATSGGVNFEGLGMNGANGGSISGSMITPTSTVGVDSHTNNNGTAMDVDGTSRHDGRMTFVHFDARSQTVEGLDPLMGIQSGELIALMTVYTQHFHSIYPILEISDVLWRLNKVTTLQEHVLTSGQTPPDRSRELLQNPDEVLNDVNALTVKMVLAIAAHSQDPNSDLAMRLYMNVQEIFSVQGIPPGWSLDQRISVGGGHSASCAAMPPYHSIFRGIRLRFLHALWQFQHGDGDSAVFIARDLIGVQQALAKRVGADPLATPDLAQACLKLNAAGYSAYWRWIMLVKSTPRFDIAIEKTPPKLHEEGTHFDTIGDGTDEDWKIVGPMFEYAKLCSITTFAFERPGPELQALQAAKPPWTKETAIDHVNRWQAGFPGGLRSLATIRPGFLAKRTAEERVTLTFIFLLAHFLRLAVCRYNRAGAADRYNGPISELYASAKYAHESIAVLHNIHEVGKTWAAHSYVYNNFLINAASWLYELLQDGAIRPSEEVKASLQKSLCLIETYARYWENAELLLEKLQESRRHGLLV